MKINNVYLFLFPYLMSRLLLLFVLTMEKSTLNCLLAKFLKNGTFFLSTTFHSKPLSGKRPPSPTSFPDTAKSSNLKSSVTPDLVNLKAAPLLNSLL